jgi:hypothetical protein
MSQETGKPKYIIVLGTTYSGSGAVYDYLAGRGDLHDPLDGEEYQLPQVPNGLMTLEAVAGQAFHPATADYALVQFEAVVQRLARPRTWWRYGKNYAHKLPAFLSTIEQFCNDVSTAHQPMRLDWHKLMAETPYQAISRLKALIGVRASPPETRLLMNPSEVTSVAQKMHDKLFHPSVGDGGPVLLNQAGSGWNPLESTKYFANCKVVLVTRDPRDQFAEIRQHKKATDVDAFVDWHEPMQKRLSGLDDPRLLRIKFEDFVHDHTKNVNNICAHLRISRHYRSTYCPAQSSVNVGKYENFLEPSEVKAMKRLLF